MFEQPPIASAEPRERDKREDDVLSNAGERMLRHAPSKRIATIAIMASLAEACAAHTAPVTPERISDRTEEERQAVKTLERVLAASSHDARGARTAVEELIGPRTGSSEEWNQFRDSVQGQSQAILNPHLIPIRVERFQGIVDALPTVWKHPNVNDHVTFLSRSDFKKEERKEIASSDLGESDKWETVCSSHYAPLEHTSSVVCNADLMKEYGAEAAINEAFFHEYAHGADPSRLPLPIEQKVSFWKREFDILNTGQAPDSAYMRAWLDATSASSNAEATAALLKEGWAEQMETVFQTAHLTAGAKNWADWQTLYEQALITYYDESPEGARNVSLLIRDYFHTVDPSFKPWESAKQLRLLLPPPARFSKHSH